MKKDKLMKKNTFINGALLVSACIIITKVLGVLYVIPFYSLVGEQGGALYSYAYNIYVFFISLSSAGIPLAISKIISEYNMLGNYDARDRAFVLGKKIAFIFGLGSFILLSIFAPNFAKIILGDLAGGNSIESVTMVIRIISTAILVVPVLGIYRGYFQGFKYMEPSSFSQILEQIVRIVIILLGSFLVLDVFKLSLATAIGVAVFGATAGAFTAYMYLLNKKLNNKNKFKNNVPKIKIPVSDITILKKIFYYAFPLCLIDLSKSIYSFIDTLTAVNGLVDYAKFTTNDAEVIVSMLSTWATKFNMIISSIATGVVVSLIPNLTESIIKGNKEYINRKINNAISLCLFFVIPMTFGMSFLSKSIWTVFYGANDVGTTLLSYFVFTGLFSSIFIVVITIMELFKDYKALFISLLIGVLAKFLFNIPLISSFYREGLPPYYGVITATLLGYILSIIFCFIYLNIKIKINFEKLITNLFDILCASIFMILILITIDFIIPITTSNRLLNLLFIFLYAILGVILFFGYCYKTKVLDSIFGVEYKKILKHIIKK